MLAEQFLKELEKRDLLDSKIIAELRQQVATIKTRVTPEAIAKLLVDNGHLTRFQATKLVSEITAPLEELAESKAKTPRKSSDDTRTNKPPQEKEDEEEELGLAPDEDDDIPARRLPQSKPISPGGLSKPFRDEDEIVELESAAPRRTEPPEPIVGLESVSAKPRPVPDSPALEPLAPFTPVAAPVPEPASFPITPTPQLPGYPPQVGPLYQKSRWDTKLIVGGGALLALLCIAGIVLYMSLTGGSASETFDAAEQEYKSGSYTQAINIYERYLRKFPTHEHASLARVRIGISRLRQAVEGSSNPEPGLKTAQEVLPTIEEESSFGEARAELSSLLPDIAAAFASRANLAKENNIDQAEQLLEQAQQAMTLVNNRAYIPTSQLTLPAVQSKIGAIQEEMQVVERAINQDRQRIAAIQQVENLVANADTVAAHDVVRQLVRKYPALERDAELRDAILNITAKERELVEVVDQPIASLTEDHPPSAQPRIELPASTASAADSSNGQAAFILASGRVYGLDVANGQVLWSRSVGVDTTFHPQPASDQPGADAILVDTQHQELVRVQAKTGDLVWRLPIGQRFSDPVITPNWILVGDESGRLLAIDPETGNSARHVKFPQSLTVGPAVDEIRSQLYQVGSHSNVYVLSLETLQCDEVYHLGHKAGTVEVPPVSVLGNLIVAENAGSNFCVLHVLGTNERGRALKPGQDPIRLAREGRVVVPLVTFARRVLLVTDLGALRVFDVDPNAEPPFREIAKVLAPADAQPMTRYPLVIGDRLWVGDRRFARYLIQTATGELPRELNRDEGGVFVAPLQHFGGVILLTLRREGSPGVSVSAIRANRGDVQWRTDLAVPGQLVPDEAGKRISAVSARGALFELTPEVLASGIGKPAQNIGTPEDTGLAFTRAIPLDEGRVALVSITDRRRILLYDPRAAEKLRLVPLQLSEGISLAETTPVYFAGGLLAPLDDGEVCVLDPESGRVRVYPFHPPLSAVASRTWLRPAVIGDSQSEFIIADDQRNLYRVGVEASPLPHLEARGQQQLDQLLERGLVAVGTTIYAVARNGNGQQIVSIHADDLTIGQQWPVKGRIVWGPERVGEMLLVVSSEEGLLCFADGEQRRWVSQEVPGPIVGHPLPAQDDVILASLNGAVWRVAGDSGDTLGSAQIGQPLGSGPVAYDGRLWLSASDGAVHVIPMIDAP